MGSGVKGVPTGRSIFDIRKKSAAFPLTPALSLRERVNLVTVPGC